MQSSTPRFSVLMLGTRNSCRRRKICRLHPHWCTTIPPRTAMQRCAVYTSCRKVYFLSSWNSVFVFTISSLTQICLPLLLSYTKSQRDTGFIILHSWTVVVYVPVWFAHTAAPTHAFRVQLVPPSASWHPPNQQTPSPCLAQPPTMLIA